MSSPSDETNPGPIELLESARTKYQLALGRLRRGPPELALLSIHGAIEDVLRAHGLRAQLPAAYEPFAQLLDALTQDRQRPLSLAEAEGIRRMHRLRARVAHGEHIVVAAETIDAYQRLAARLLPRYGVLIVGPEGEAAPAGGAPATTTTTRRRGDTISILRDEPMPPARRGDTVRIEREAPRRERTVYPEGAGASYLGRAGPSRATADLPLARELASSGRYGRGEGPRRGPGSAADFWARSQGWLLPALAIISIFLIGAVISISLQQLRAEPAVPTAALPPASGAEATPFVPPSTTAAAMTSSVDGAAPVTQESPAASAVATAPPATALAPGRTAYVREGSEDLNVRERAGTGPDSPVVFSLAPGTAVEILAGPVEVDGFTWWQVRGPVGDGWCAGQFLEVR